MKDESAIVEATTAVKIFVIQTQGNDKCLSIQVQALRHFGDEIKVRKQTR